LEEILSSTLEVANKVLVVGSSVDDDKVLLVVAKDADEADIIIAFQMVVLKNHPDDDADAANAAEKVSRHPSPF
jgi:uncharacterized NAD(P)/FAD-binding protein YdhS